MDSETRMIEVPNEIVERGKSEFMQRYDRGRILDLLRIHTTRNFKNRSVETLEKKIEIPVRLWNAIKLRADEKNTTPEKWVEWAVNEEKRESEPVSK